ncbi:MAG: tripartite tricarboxylate transporter substrate binding protein [Pigmentiphaga sp.]|uniref:Bug family tripartite tricarboxylate transporter substrate binding protein n=1 Tax=Pigmentiphaga sp. TaxID=1977564 RepID=UPI0029B850C0|nr:tripartite tricarboxylate transporter substrate binding protein [Pigmentiphaga sp.]MDX3907800.1 tripartite tricarboxylate transporter substrate binding protein [Pigmentiphaga sp.]
MRTRRHIAGLALACLALPAHAATADSYPSKPIQIVLGFPPGGSTDILARLVAQHLQQAWDRPVIVVNKPGASTIIATESVAKAPPDGYTLLVGASSAMTINPVLYRSLPYDPKRDLSPVAIMGSFPLVLAVQPSMSVKTVSELITAAKAASPPLNYSSASTLFQLAGEMFKQMSGTEITHIPYKGSVQALTALTTGDVHMLFLDPAPVITQMKAGKARALAVTSARRWPLMAEVPTMTESGVPGYDFASWIALFTPAGTPPDIVTKIQREVSRIVELPEVRQRLETLGIDAGGRALGIEPADNTPASLARVIDDEAKRFAQVIRTANIKAE